MVTPDEEFVDEYIICPRCRLGLLVRIGFKLWRCVLCDVEVEAGELCEPPDE